VNGRFTFIGTATVLIEVGEVTLLTDPNFLHAGQHAPLGGGLRSMRLTDPAMELEALPPLDAVVLSHHHGDHFDPEVVERLDKGTKIITTPGSTEKLRKQGFGNVSALRTWERTEVRRGTTRVAVTAVPAKHAPTPLDKILPSVMGSVLDVEIDGRHRHRAYVTGDTLLHDRLDEIPREFPGIDLCLLHLGGTRIAGILLTMDAKQGVEALRRIDPDEAIPIHHSDYTVFKSPIEDFRDLAGKADLRTSITYLGPGETHEVDLG
jgi:L-ascorbate metabolism protein UlaG (beta-lactamase superfamily)